MNCRHCFHWTEAGEECCECSHLVNFPPNNKAEQDIQRARREAREEILNILEERMEDLNFCTKDDNCKELAEIIKVCIDDINYESRK